MWSMGTINYTKINFTLLELIHLVGRVELMNDIMHFKLADSDVYVHIIAVQNALDAAISDINKFGMNFPAEDIRDCKLKDIQIDLDSDDQCVNDEIIDLGIGSDHNSNPIECQNLKDYSDRAVENSSFVSVPGKNGPKTVRKSTYMWSISDTKDKLSSDRLRRVQKKKPARRQLEFVDVSIIDHPISKADDIKIGDWCIFRHTFKNTASENAKLIFGNILSFRYIKSKTIKLRQYSWDVAPVSHEKNSRGVEVLAAWYEMDTNEIKSLNCNSSFFVNIDQYVATISRNAIEKGKNETIHLKQKYLNSIRIDLQRYQL